MEQEAKVSTAKTLWVPAVNNAGTWGRWDFVEITDPWDGKAVLRKFIAAASRRASPGETSSTSGVSS